MPIKPEATMEEYIRVKRARKAAKVAIVNFVKKFKEENDGQNPADEDTAPIATALAKYNEENEKYLDIKLSLIKSDRMPFQAEEFGSLANTQGGPLQRRMTAKRPMMLGDATPGLTQAQDKFLATLSNFGAAAEKTGKESVMSPSSKANETKVNQTLDNAAFF